MKSKLVIFLCFITVFVSACDDGGFSGPIAFKQVPIEDNTNNTGANNDEGTVDLGSVVSDPKPTTGTVTDGTAKTMDLRDKVLMNTDISETALDNALDYFDQNASMIKNKKVITIFDITKHSGLARLYVIDTNTGSVSLIHVAHGKNSDKNSDGIATEFSNTSNSLQSSLGFMLTAETYFGKNGYSLRLDGLESRNSKVRQRAVVVHGANYVSSSLSKMGMSYGCPAVSHSHRDWLINKIKNGSLLYIYHARHDG